MLIHPADIRAPTHPSLVPTHPSLPPFAPPPSKHVPDTASSPCSPTHVQLRVPASIHQPCFVIIKPPLLALLSLLYVTCMGLPPPAVEGLTLFSPGPHACVWICECVHVFVWVYQSTLCACPHGHVLLSVHACLFSCLCVCVHAGPWSALRVCVCM